MTVEQAAIKARVAYLFRQKGYAARQHGGILAYQAVNYLSDVTLPPELEARAEAEAQKMIDAYLENERRFDEAMAAARKENTDADR